MEPLNFDSDDVELIEATVSKLYSKLRTIRRVGEGYDDTFGPGATRS